MKVTLTAALGVARLLALSAAGAQDDKVDGGAPSSSTTDAMAVDTRAGTDHVVTTWPSGTVARSVGGEAPARTAVLHVHRPGVDRNEARIDGRLWLLSNPVHLREIYARTRFSTRAGRRRLVYRAIAQTARKSPPMAARRKPSAMSVTVSVSPMNRCWPNQWSTAHS
jgi:hypothetical protein